MSKLRVPAHEEARHRRRYARGRRRAARRAQDPVDAALQRLGYHVEPGAPATRTGRSVSEVVERDARTWSAAVSGQLKHVTLRAATGLDGLAGMLGRGMETGDAEFDAAVFVDGPRRLAFALLEASVRSRLLHWLGRGLVIRDGTLTWTWSADVDVGELRGELAALGRLARALVLRAPRVDARLAQGLAHETSSAVARGILEELGDEGLRRYRKRLGTPRHPEVRVEIARRLGDVGGLVGFLGHDEPGLRLLALDALEGHHGVTGVAEAILGMGVGEDVALRAALEQVALRLVDEVPARLEVCGEGALLALLAVGRAERRERVLQRLGAVGTAVGLPEVVAVSRGVLRRPRIRAAAAEAAARIVGRVERERGAVSVAVGEGGGLAVAVEVGGLSEGEA